MPLDLPIAFPAIIALAVAVVALLGLTLFRVGPRTAAIVQRLGKFSREAGPGFHLKVPFLDQVVGQVNLRIQKLDMEIAAETNDGVGIKLFVTVHYYVLPASVVDSFYKLDDVSGRIAACLVDIGRMRLRKLRHEDVSENKDQIAKEMQTRLVKVMKDFGYRAHKVLLTDIELDPVGKIIVSESAAGVVVREEDRDAERDAARDVQRDAERDEERDDTRDFERDEQRDEVRDAIRDSARDSARDQRRAKTRNLPRS